MNDRATACEPAGPLLQPSITAPVKLAARYRKVRGVTEELCDSLETEDFVGQSMPEASPIKWHLAHTSWFFEIFILKEYVPGYESAVPEYAYLFNSYYNAAGPMHCRDRRGVISRPTVRETHQYRRHIDEAILALLENPAEEAMPGLERLLTLGLNHEQQHQELMLTDIKHLFFQNPLLPVFRQPDPSTPARSTEPIQWIDFAEGVYPIGNDGNEFSYDNEGPRHRQFIEPFSLATRLVTNGEFREFMEDGGYERPELWLSLGWHTVNECNWRAPLYWFERDGEWFQFTLQGARKINKNEPVSHVSFYEADAYARWAGAWLPTEAQWETAARRADPGGGNFVDDRILHPAAPAATNNELPAQLFGDLWEWTASSYRPYPGYRPVEGALGEYNGKFMSNQMVLRGGSCATSRDHIRSTYRNFFPPEKRWQFSGIRLAKEIQ